MPAIGELIFVNGNEAAVVIHIDDEDNLIVAHFAGTSQVEKGNYGFTPGVKPENPPSFVPEGAPAVVPGVGVPVIPTAGVPVAVPAQEAQPAQPQAAPIPAVTV